MVATDLLEGSVHRTVPAGRVEEAPTGRFGDVGEPLAVRVPEQHREDRGVLLPLRQRGVEEKGLAFWAPLTPAAASISLAGSLLLGKAKSNSLRASWSIAQEPEVSVFTV